MTNSPDLMEALDADDGELPRQLSPESVSTDDPKVSPSESVFRFDLNEDAMATEKLAEGIRNFVKDQIKLETLIGSMD